MLSTGKLALIASRVKAGAQKLAAVTIHTKSVDTPRGPRDGAKPPVEDKAWTPIVDRSFSVIDRTLAMVPQLAPGERQAAPDAVLEAADLPNPAGKARAVVTFGINPDELTRFAQEQNLLFDNARDVKDFSGERIHDVPAAVTALTPRLPLGHAMEPAELSQYAANGMDVDANGVKLQGFDYLMQLRPLHRTADGGTTGWNTQQAHFHQGEEFFHDQRLLHGVVPQGVTVVLFHPGGAEVAPGGTFVAIKIDPRAGHQFCTIHDQLLWLNPALRNAVRQPGALDAQTVIALHQFLDRHKVIPGVEFDELTKADLARASALVVSSHTKDAAPSGEEGENLMAKQTMAIANPEKYGAFLPWSDNAAGVPRDGRTK
ncbi:hypothetical protein [Ramlibacter albus]|uniref:Uncharacterized protein n=1 Tax=Ramlibacter albus TaxID=2079448 RepID=A0A923S1J8_9BURK|nr:hypothetical protein [Ramlibacter albus]MBC5764360.1 hypothetical protein [Ramlibacter albus]